MNVEDAVTNVSKLERLIFRVLNLFRRFGLPEPIDKAITKIQQLIMTMRMLQVATAALLSTNPLTVALGVTAVIGLAASFQSEMLEGY